MEDDRFDFFCAKILGLHVFFQVTISKLKDELKLIFCRHNILEADDVGVLKLL